MYLCMCAYYIFMCVCTHVRMYRYMYICVPRIWRHTHVCVCIVENTGSSYVRSELWENDGET